MAKRKNFYIRNDFRQMYYYLFEFAETVSYRMPFLNIKKPLHSEVVFFLNIFVSAFIEEVFLEIVVVIIAKTFVVFVCKVSGAVAFIKLRKFIIN